jgi:hypothetical protein
MLGQALHTNIVIDWVQDFMGREQPNDYLFIISCKSHFVTHVAQSHFFKSRETLHLYIETKRRLLKGNQSHISPRKKQYLPIRLGLT